MYVPKPILALTLLAVLLLAGWSAALATDRNPIPFPDRNYAVFTTPSPEAKAAMIELLGRHGYRPRFRADSEGVERAIFWDGTILNYTAPELFERLGRPGAAVGLVVDDPATSALEAVRHLRERGFRAAMIEGAEPGLPIVFVTTDALNGSALVFRRHVLRMGTRPDAWD
jgi:CheY-like chemotaxis protein